MMSENSVWSDWLRRSVPADQFPHILQAMAEVAGLETLDDALEPLRPPRQGGESDSIRVTRTPTRDLYVAPPKFVDVYDLMPLLTALSFEQNLIIKGPSGVGKSLAIFEWAHNHKIPVVVEECTEDTRDFRLKGTQTIAGGNFLYILGSLPTAIEVANETGKCVLLLDEVNALPPTTQKALNAIADFRKRVTLHNIGRTYELRKGAKLWVTATMNPTSYSGTYELNRDLRSRFEEVEVDYLPEAKESALLKALFGKDKAGNPTPFPIENFVRLAQETRKEKKLYPLSPRDLERVLFNAERLGTHQALSLVMGRADGDKSKDLLTARINDIFGSGVAFHRTWGEA